MVPSSAHREGQRHSCEGVVSLSSRFWIVTPRKPRTNLAMLQDGVLDLHGHSARGRAGGCPEVRQSVWICKRMVRHAITWPRHPSERAPWGHDIACRIPRPKVAPSASDRHGPPLDTAHAGVQPLASELGNEQVSAKRCESVRGSVIAASSHEAWTRGALAASTLRGARNEDP
jgi:hypothetical protein